MAIPRSGATEEKRGGIPPRLVAAAIIVIALVVFVVENTKRVDVRFLLPTVHGIPLWVALFIAVLFGAAAGALLARRGRRE